LDLPLAKGKGWGSDGVRDDHWYCWYVEKAALTTVKGDRIQAGTGQGVDDRLPHNPAHELMDLAAGLGITRYVYEHHGTVASADVRLISFRKKKWLTGHSPA